MTIWNWISEWVTSGDFWKDLIMTAFSGFIFYYFFDVRKKEKQEKRLEGHIIYILERILFFLLVTIEDTTAKKIPQSKIAHNDLTEEDIKNALFGVHMSTHIASQGGRSISIGEMVNKHLANLKEESEPF